MSDSITIRIPTTTAPTLTVPAFPNTSTDPTTLKNQTARNVVAGENVVGGNETQTSGDQTITITPTTPTDPTAPTQTAPTGPGAPTNPAAPADRTIPTDPAANPPDATDPTTDPTPAAATPAAPTDPAASTDPATSDPAPSTNQIAGTNGPDVVIGTDQSDSISLLAGNDAAVPKLGDDFVEGGAGYDTVVISGVRKGFAFSGGPGPRATVNGPEGSDTFNNVERFKFVDGEFFTNADSTAGQVHRVYGATLDREPDAAGLRFWNDHLEAGLPLQQMVDGFTASPEFTAKYGSATSNTAFVDLLYLNVLGRSGEAAGAQSWVDALEAGGATRAQVVLGFSESSENIGKSQAAIEAGLWVGDTQAAVAARVYHSTLDRAPDLGGLAFWTGFLNAGNPVNAMVDGFTSSPEFRAKYGPLDNAAFVDLLYVNVLDRPANPAGKAGWVNALNSGAAMRAEVVLGFSESQEYVVKLAPVIDNGIVVA